MFIDCCLQCFFSTLNFICLTLYAHNCILSIPMLSYQALVVARGSLPSQNIYIYGAQIYTTYYTYLYLHVSIYLNRTKQILEYRKETFDSRGMSTINGTVIIAHKIDVKRK